MKSLTAKLCLGWMTFYYLGLCLGNSLIQVRTSNKALVLLYIGTLLIQIGEGFYLNRFGISNVGSQLKVSNVLSTSLILLMAYRYITSGSVNSRLRALKLVGDYSFGIYTREVHYGEARQRGDEMLSLCFILWQMLV